MLSPEEIVLTSCTQCNKPPAAIHHAFRQATWGITGRDGAGGGGGGGLATHVHPSTKGCSPKTSEEPAAEGPLY